MVAIEELITNNLNVWSSALKKKSATGRGNNKKVELYGIKKLRELILELAVHGLLVPQNANDEPARELLKKVAIEKEQLLNDNKTKKHKNLPAISDEEASNIRPKGWSESRLGHLFHIVYGKGLPNKELLPSGYPVFGANGIIGHYDKYLYETQQLLISCRGAYSGKPNISPAKCFVTSNSLILENTWRFLSQKYFYYALTAADKTNLVTGSAQPQVTTTNLEPFIVGVPPLHEQRRIVAKVDELMGLCDQLEQQTEDSLSAHQTLVDTLLSALTNAADHESFQSAWKRIAEHFDILITTEDSIEQLKQVILQLAVMGKLVPQDPNDEPASELLKKIAAEKAQLVEDKNIKKQKPLPKISDDEKPFGLPAGWEWSRLDSLSINSQAGWSPKCHGTAREDEKWGVLKVSAVTWGVFKPEENKELPDHLQPKPEFEIKENDFLISRANTAELVARSVVVPANTGHKLMMSDKIIRFVFSKYSNPNYLNLVNNSFWSRNYYAAVAGGTSSSMKNVSRKQIQMLVVAIPPAREQARIISKVEVIIKLCEQLKQRLNDSQKLTLKIADAIVHEAL